MIKKIVWSLGIMVVCMLLMGQIVLAQEYIPHKNPSYGKHETGWVKWYKKGATTYSAGARDSVVVVASDTCYSSIYENADNVVVQIRAVDRSSSNDSLNIGIEILGAILVPGILPGESEFKRVYAGYLTETIVSVDADSIQTQNYLAPYKIYTEEYNLVRFMAYPLDNNDLDGNVVLRIKIDRVNY